MADGPANHSQPASGYRPRYSSLDDYLQVLRRRRWLILALTVVGAGIGIALALSAAKTYTAEASLSFRDPSQDLALFGVDTLPENSPAVRAAVNAERVTRPEVTNHVAKRFKGELTPAQLYASIAARVGAQTQLVVLDATSSTAAQAAEIANAYAQVNVKLGTAQNDERLARVERSLRDQINSLSVKDLQTKPGTGVKISVLEQQFSRVKTLRDISKPVEITQKALPPSAPDNASAAATGFVGALIGLVAGLIAAFTRDALDRRIRTSSEVHSELGFPIVGRVTEGALGYPGLARVAGRAPIEESDFEAFRVIRTNLGFMTEGGPPPRCVLVAGSQPEEGKTTVAMSLASAAAVGGQRVLLLEGDLRRPSFAGRLGINASPGLAEYLRGTADPSQVVQLVDLYPPSQEGAASPQPSARLACITAGAAGADAAELLASQRFKHFIGEIRDAYELVVIDSSPLLAVVDPLELVEQSDAILFCTRAHRTTRDELRAARSALANLPERPCGVVVTGMRRDGPDAYSYYYGY